MVKKEVKQGWIKNANPIIDLTRAVRIDFSDIDHKLESIQVVRLKSMIKLVIANLESIASGIDEVGSNKSRIENARHLMHLQRLVEETTALLRVSESI